MPMGPGKYDAECEALLRETDAHAVLLIILGGKRGTGFSMNTMNPALLAAVPGLLRKTADQIEAALREPEPK